jgi:hypothetical protein
MAAIGVVAGLLAVALGIAGMVSMPDQPGASMISIG